ncbi:hypothetical protein ACJDU8_03125 [Clostridium sp. WILCCON 0269]|uniref:Uncharacterized protein n=1 Tax=Candidatus Clostridium eludens TaxID=3381663 RepID=A0ABW8SF33_9CLOT
MKSIKVIGNSCKFTTYLMSLLHEMDLHYNIFINNDDNEKVEYILLNSINEQFKILNSGYCFVNMDLISGEKSNVDICGYIITYGLGSKNTVTISSLDYNSGFVYCLQRDIMCRGRKIVESQEIPVNIILKDIEQLYASMIAITIGLMEGKYDNDLFKNKIFNVLI